MVSAEASRYLDGIDVQFFRLRFGSGLDETLAALVLLSLIDLLSPFINRTGHVTALEFQTGKLILIDAGRAVGLFAFRVAAQEGRLLRRVSGIVRLDQVTFDDLRILIWPNTAWPTAHSARLGVK